MIIKYIVKGVGILFIVLFVYAAYHKLREYNGFVFQLGQSPYTTNYKHTLVWLVPAVELLISCLLFISILFGLDRIILFSLYGSFTLMALFTGYIYMLLRYSYYVPCACGGILSGMTWSKHLIFNAVCTAVLVVSILLYPAKPRAKRQLLTLPT